MERLIGLKKHEQDTRIGRTRQISGYLPEHPEKICGHVWTHLTLKGANMPRTKGWVIPTLRNQVQGLKSQNRR